MTPAADNDHTKVDRCSLCLVTTWSFSCSSAAVALSSSAFIEAAIAGMSTAAMNAERTHADSLAAALGAATAKQGKGAPTMPMPSELVGSASVNSWESMVQKT